jgi:heme O synthase-like polyprenyltransferase
MNKIGLYWELAKPRILSMVLVTMGLGFFLGAHGLGSVLRFCLLLPHLFALDVLLTIFGSESADDLDSHTVNGRQPAASG